MPKPEKAEIAADSKAALHSYSIALRLTLASTSNIKVLEVFPSLIDTEGTRACLPASPPKTSLKVSNWINMKYMSVKQESSEPHS
jgi:short-subunit dehydrogenase involved in D-alanine esterification of teichoic acids